MNVDTYRDKNCLNRYHIHVLNYIKPGTQVLDLGCRFGIIDRELKAKGCLVTGVDINPEDLNKAGQFCERAICGDIENERTLEVLGVKFDYILFLDVLEHLRFPDKILLYVKKFLNDRGVIITNIPNISFWTTRLTILSGEFKYDPSGGIFDSGHIRFFNYHTMRKLFLNAGYEIVHVKPWVDFPGGNLVSQVPFLINLFAVAITFVIKPAKAEY